MIKLYIRFVGYLNKLRDLPLLCLRLVLAYGFWEPATSKWSDIDSVAGWFREMGMAAPEINAYLAATTEICGVFMLTLGLGTRLISIPLMITMMVAIKMVHWESGFHAADNGFEIPLYYLIMLFTLLCFGAGRLSVDHLITRWIKRPA